MAIALSPVFQPDSAQIDASGNPRTGAKLFTYVASTTTKVTTFKDSLGAASHTNPIVLDANGLSPFAIWLTTGAAVKFVLAPSTDTDPPTSPILTIDNVSAVNDLAATAATEWTSSGFTPTYVSATSFTVPGDQTSALEVNRRIKATVTAGTVYGTITRTVFTTLTTVTVLIDSGALDSGLSALSYGILSTSNTSLPLISRNQQCGRLTRTSTTLIQLDPSDGNTIWVFTGSFWRRRTIPSTGVTAANTSVFIDGTGGLNLAASAVYFVYLFDNAGVLTMDFSTTAPVVDATSGLKVKTGATTRTLIGIARTNASSQFELVLSWYRRRAILGNAAFTTSRFTNSTSLVEVNSEIRVYFLSWAEEAVMAQYACHAANNVAGSSHETRITLDGIVTTIGGIIVNAPAINYNDNVSLGGLANVTDGYHYVTIAGAVNANTATWSTGILSVQTRG